MDHRVAVFVVCTFALSFVKPAEGFLFVKIPGIPGDAIVQGHEGEIEVQSLGFSGGQIVPKAGPKPCAAPTRKTQISAIALQKPTDVASPKLLMAAGQGTVFPDVTISIAIPSGDVIETLAQYKLKNAFVSSYEVGSTGDRPNETVSLSFMSLDFTNFGATPETATWNFCGVTP
jgi:type VI secretion system secreted protein Hcp